MKRLRFLTKIRAKFADALDVDANRKMQLSIDLSKAATLRDFVYWLQIFFSAGIATLGLVLNSPAVIIGAMLISPLMGPILSAGLALATGDLILGIRAIINLALSSLAAIAFAVFLVALLPFKEMTAEIASRTSPNTLDLFVALFSGAIGSIATCRETKGVVTSIPGVAIAVALMPPLCVVGYGIGVAVSFNAADGMKAAWGGGLLFLTNLFAITFTAMIVFLLLRIDTSNVRNRLEQWRRTDAEDNFVSDLIRKIPVLDKAQVVRSLSLRMLMILLPLLVIVFPLSSSFSKLKNEIYQKQAENLVKKKALSLWQDRFERTTSGEIRSFVDTLTVTENDGTIGISLRVFDNQAYSEAEKKEYARELAAQLSAPPESIEFQLIEIPTALREKTTFEEKPKEVTLSELHSNFVQKAKASLSNLPFPASVKLIDYELVSSPKMSLNLHFWYVGEADLSSDAKDLIGQNVRQYLKIPAGETEFSFISTQYAPLTFTGNTAEIAETKELEAAANQLIRHESLGLSVLLRPANGDPKQSLEDRKKAVTDLFADRNIDAGRIAFTESETKSEFAIVILQTP